MTPVTAAPAPKTLADVLHQIGDVSPERIPASPAPGTATEEDVIAAMDGPEKRLYELVDGVLVEKIMATKEGILASLIAHFLWTFVAEERLGVVSGADGPVKLHLALVRIPDVWFASWDRFPGGEASEERVIPVVPDLAVEVLSPGNTKAEMDRKLHDYFKAGVRLAWWVQPKTQTATVYTSPTKSRRVGKEQALDGGDVLPGFRLPLKELFVMLKRPQRKSR
jgi:Uma2 family endonuclease